MRNVKRGWERQIDGEAKCDKAMAHGKTEREGGEQVNMFLLPDSDENGLWLP